MTYLLQKNGYLESLKNRASVSTSLKQKLDAARLGLNYGEEIGEDEEIDEEDETQMMMLFKSQVNKLLTKPLSVARFHTEFPNKYIPYFSSVFPKLQNMYRGTSPDPFVLKNMAIGLIEQVLQSSAQSSSVNIQQQQQQQQQAQAQAQASNSVNFPASKKKEQKKEQNKYTCAVCGKQVLNKKANIIQHNSSKFHTKALTESRLQTKLNPHPLPSDFYEIFDNEDTRLIN